MKTVIFPVTAMGLLCLCLLFPGCDEAGHASNASDEGLHGKLVLTGSSTVAPLANEIAKRFEQLHPEVRIDVQTGGSSRGIADARRGTSDIGMASRALKPQENDLVPHTIAVDGVTMILHRDNPVEQLTDDQIIAIYTVGITNWSQVGGRDAGITAVNKAEGRATPEVFLEHFHLVSSDIKASIVVGDNQQGIRTVGSDPDAIGYVSVGTADYERSRGIPLRLLPMEGVAATVSNVRSGAFAMSRPLNLLTHGPVSSLAQAFIDYAQSSAVNDLVEAQYFVPVAD